MLEEEIIVIEDETEEEIVVLEEAIEKVYPELEDLTVIPSKENQQFKSEKYGYDMVIVNAIPNEYVIATGEINIIENGIYDVKEKAIANVNIPEKKLGTKTISSNGVYNATDEGLDGYSQVEVMAGKYSPRFISFYNYTGTELDEEINNLDTSKIDRFFYTFGNCSKLTTIPQIDTSLGTTFSYMFYNCSKLTTIPQIDTSLGTTFSYMCYRCSALTTIPQIDTSLGKDFSYMCYGCSALTTIPQIDTSSGTTFSYMFGSVDNLIKIPELNFGSASSINAIFSSSKNHFTDFGGFKDLGKAYSKGYGANSYAYTLDLSSCNALTEQSLINVLTNLYDIATNGCKTQTVQLGSTNLAKLTSEAGQQALAQATAYGWTVS